MAKYQIGIVVIDNKSEVGSLVLSEHFISEDALFKAGILRDILFDVQQAYQTAINQIRDEFDAARAKRGVTEQ